MGGEKPGYKTTEFWLTVATNVAALLGSVAGTLPPEKAAIVLTVVNSIYSVVRGWTKTAG